MADELKSDAPLFELLSTLLQQVRISVQYGVNPWGGGGQFGLVIKTKWLLLQIQYRNNEDLSTIGV